MNPSDPEPEPYRNLSRRQLIDRIQSLTIESAKHRRGKRYWKNYAQQPDVYLEVQHPCWSCNSNSSSANASAGVR